MSLYSKRSVEWHRKDDKKREKEKGNTIWNKVKKKKKIGISMDGKCRHL